MRIRHAAVLIAVLTLAACASTVSVDTEPSPRTQPPTRTTEYRGQPTTAAPLHIPPGHLPAPGMCRVWIPGVPPGRQPRADRCSVLGHGIPAGAMLLYRPSSDKSHVHVSYFDEVRPEIVVAVRVYVASSGRYVRDITP